MDTSPVTTDDASLNVLPPDRDEMNAHRAAAAERALLAFAPHFGGLVVDGEDYTGQALGDLLAGIGHLCDRKGLDLRLLLHTASLNYNEDTGSLGPQFSGVS